MASLTGYKGLQIVTPTPTGAGGEAIQNNLTSLVDWSPKSSLTQASDPTSANDISQNYYPGSLWLRTNVTPPKLFICKSNAPGSAEWVQLLFSVLDGNLNVNGNQIVSASGNIVLMPGGSGNTGIGTASPNSVLTTGGAIATPYVGVNSAHTLGASDSVLACNATSAAFNVTLPDATLATGRTYTVKRTNTNPNNVTVVTSDSQTIDGASAYVLGAPNQSVTLVSNGTNWLTLSAILRLINDPAPTLGANLNVNGNQIVSASGNVVLMPGGTGNTGIGTASPHSVLTTGGAIATPYVGAASAYTLAASDSVLACDATSAAFNVTLPSAIDTAGRTYTIKRTNTNANNVTVVTTTATPPQTIDGASTYVLGAPNQSVTLVSNGANWLTLSAILRLLNDPAPTLGANLNVNGNQIVSASNGNIVLAPNGTGRTGIGTASPNSVLTTGGAIATPIAYKDASFLLAATDSVVWCNATSAAFNVTLPDATVTTGRTYTIKRTNSNANNVTVITTTATPPQTIDGASTYVLGAPNQSVTLVSNGTNWLTLSGILRLINDPAPTLGANLNVNGNQIVSASGNIVLLSGGAGNTGIGTASPHSVLTTGGAIATPYVGAVSAYTLGVSDSVLACDATSAAFNVTLPTAVGTAGRTYMVKRTNSNANNVTIVTSSGQTIDGVSTYVLGAPNQSVTLVSTGGQWLTLSGILRLINDPAPTLGANLDVNGNQIVSASNGNIVLAPNGTGQVRVGASAEGATLSVAGSVSTSVTAVTSSTSSWTYNVQSSDSILICDSSFDGFTVALPTAASAKGRAITIKRVNTGGSSKKIVINAVWPNGIDGNLTYELTSQYESVTIVSNGTHWWIVSKK